MSGRPTVNRELQPDVLCETSKIYIVAALSKTFAEEKIKPWSRKRIARRRGANS